MSREERPTSTFLKKKKIYCDECCDEYNEDYDNVESVTNRSGNHCLHQRVPEVSSRDSEEFQNQNHSYPVNANSSEQWPNNWQNHFTSLRKMWSHLSKTNTLISKNEERRIANLTPCEMKELLELIFPDEDSDPSGWHLEFVRSRNRADGGMKRNDFCQCTCAPQDQFEMQSESKSDNIQPTDKIRKQSSVGSFQPSHFTQTVEIKPKTPPELRDSPRRSMTGSRRPSYPLRTPSPEQGIVQIYSDKISPKVSVTDVVFSNHKSKHGSRMFETGIKPSLLQRFTSKIQGVSKDSKRPHEDSSHSFQPYKNDDNNQRQTSRENKLGSHHENHKTLDDSHRNAKQNSQRISAHNSKKDVGNTKSHYEDVWENSNGIASKSYHEHERRFSGKNESRLSRENKDRVSHDNRIRSFHQDRGAIYENGHTTTKQNDHKVFSKTGQQLSYENMEQFTNHENRINHRSSRNQASRQNTDSLDAWVIVDDHRR